MSDARDTEPACCPFHANAMPQEPDSQPWPATCAHCHADIDAEGHGLGCPEGPRSFIDSDPGPASDPGCDVDIDW